MLLLRSPEGNPITNQRLPRGLESILDRILWGTGSVFESRRTAVATVVVCSLFGAATGIVLGAQLGVTQLALAFGLLLTAPLAVAKTATACGINALGTFAQYRQPLTTRLGAALIYSITSTVVAACLGLVISLVGQAALQGAPLVLVPPFFILLGLRELGLFRWLPVPTRSWQVPDRWVRDARLAPVVWGAFLGSGFATWMPHASFYGLLMLAAILPFPAGVILLALYGFNRSVPAIVAAISARCSDYVALSMSLRLRLLGHMLNAAACVALGSAVGVLLLGLRLPGPGQFWELMMRAAAGNPFVAAVSLPAAGVLAVSAFGKLLAPARFARVLRETYRFGQSAAIRLSVVVITSEVACSGLLLLPDTRRVGLVLTTLFLAAIWSVATFTIVTGGTGDCGCFGALLDTRLGGGTLLRLSVMLIAVTAASAAALGDVLPQQSMRELPTGILVLVSVPTLLLCAALVGTVRRLLRARAIFGS